MCAFVCVSINFFVFQVLAGKNKDEASRLVTYGDVSAPEALQVCASPPPPKKNAYAIAYTPHTRHHRLRHSAYGPDLGRPHTAYANAYATARTAYARRSSYVPYLIGHAASI